MLRSFMPSIPCDSNEPLHVCDEHHAERAQDARPTQKTFYCAPPCNVCTGLVMTNVPLPRPGRKRLQISRKRLPESRSSVCIYRQLAERNPAFSRSL